MGSTTYTFDGSRIKFTNPRTERPATSAELDLWSQLQAAQAERDEWKAEAKKLESWLGDQRGPWIEEVKAQMVPAIRALERERDALREALERAIPAIHGPTHNCRFEDCQIPARQGISCAELRAVLWTSISSEVDE